MVSFTSRNPSFFSTATGFLVLAFALYGSSCGPVNMRETTPTVQDIRKELYWGMRVLIQRNNHGIFTNMDITREDINNTRPIVDNLNTSVMCDMYDFYRDYSTVLANIRPDSPDSTIKADYSAAQYVALKNTLSACQWINSINSSVLIDGCTLSSISTTCYSVRYHRMVRNETLMEIFNPRNEFGSNVNWNGSLGCYID